MPLSDPLPRYRYYLLACWEERGTNPGGTPRWRFSRQDPRTGERWGFADLEALVAALRHELEEGGMKGKTGRLLFGIRYRTTVGAGFIDEDDGITRATEIAACSKAEVIRVP